MKGKCYGKNSAYGECNGCHWYNEEDDDCEICGRECHDCDEPRTAINVKVGE